MGRGWTFRDTLDGRPVVGHLDIDGGIILGAGPWRVACVWKDFGVSSTGGMSTEHFAMTIARTGGQGPNRLGVAVIVPPHAGHR